MYRISKRFGKLAFSFTKISKAFAHFRHPISLPEDVGHALSFQVSNFISVHQLLEIIIDDQFFVKNLSRFMPREQAELFFYKATTKDYFLDRSIFSFSFQNELVEFVLEFDAMSRLRRLYLRHPSILMQKGKELALSEASIDHKHIKKISIG